MNFQDFFYVANRISSETLIPWFHKLQNSIPTQKTQYPVAESQS